MIDQQPTSSFLARFQGLGILVALMWSLELLDWLTPGHPLDQWGIHPRSLSGLLGIVISPLLHSSWSHLIANTTSFVLLGGLIALHGSVDFWLVTVVSGVVSGLGTWLVSPSNTITVGASGIIFGYFGYLLLRGFFERKIGSILISIAIAISYGGIILQVFPSERGVSWPAHFFGLVGGVMIAQFLGTRKRNSTWY